MIYEIQKDSSLEFARHVHKLSAPRGCHPPSTPCRFGRLAANCLQPTGTLNASDMMSGGISQSKRIRYPSLMYIDSGRLYPLKPLSCRTSRVEVPRGTSKRETDGLKLGGG